MKTAEETLKYINQMGYSEGVEAIKAYGKQCAEQALKDAAENFDAECNRYVILSTPIITP